MRYLVLVGLPVLLTSCMESSPSTPIDAEAGSAEATSEEPPVAETARRVAELERRLGDLSRELGGFRQEVQAGFLRVSLRPVTLNRSAAETCHQHGETCVAVESSRTYDRRGRFWGHAVFSCSARVIRRSHCMPGHDYYLTGPSSFHRPRNTEVPGMPGEGLCLSVPSYFAAVCAAPRSASSL